MSEALLVVAILFVVAGGGIVVIDAFIIRRLRRGRGRAGDER